MEFAKLLCCGSATSKRKHLSETDSLADSQFEAAREGFDTKLDALSWSDSKVAIDERFPYF